MQKLKARWGISSNLQLIIIFIVFAITGSLSAYLSKPVTNYIGLTEANLGFFYWPVRLIAIFPLYQILLVFIGYLLGQFQFFWEFEKKMLLKMNMDFVVNFVERNKKRNP